MRFSMDSGRPRARRRRRGRGNRNLGAFARRPGRARGGRRTGRSHASCGAAPPEGRVGGRKSGSHGVAFAVRRPRPLCPVVSLVSNGGRPPEFARILKPRRRLAICWNRRSASDPLTAGYRAAIVEVGGEITAESMSFDPDVIGHSGLFSPPERKSFPNFQRLDLDGLIGRARSASYTPKSGAAGERLLSLLRALHERHADASGFVTLVYETEVFCSSKLLASS